MLDAIGTKANEKKPSLALTSFKGNRTDLDLENMINKAFNPDNGPRRLNVSSFPSPAR